MHEKSFDFKDKKYTQTMKIEDIDMNFEDEKKEDKRKQLTHYKTFKKKQKNELVGFQINIIDDEEKEAKEQELLKLLKKESTIKGEQLSGSNVDSEL